MYWALYLHLVIPPCQYFLANRDILHQGFPICIYYIIIGDHMVDLVVNELDTQISF